MQGDENAKLETDLKKAKNIAYQFERNGYFKLDRKNQKILIKFSTDLSLYEIHGQKYWPRKLSEILVYLV